MDEIEHIAEGPARLAAARSGSWILLATLFEYPDAELLELVRKGEVEARLRMQLAQSAPELAEASEAVSWSALRQGGADDELAIEYTRLFDVGPSGPPCPLYGGHYAGDRMKTMEEAIRFYNHFGLRPAESPRELPDHLVTELEFLHFLSFREAQALGEGADTGPWCRAQRDFVQRHPGRWVPRLRERVEKQRPMPFYRVLANLLEALLAREARRLVTELGPTPEA